MADDNEEAEEEPVVQLGEGKPVEGAPLARVSSRLTWAQQKSEVIRKEGETLVRTPDGPKKLGDLLDQVEETYFSSRPEFEGLVRDVIGTDPVPTADES